MDLKNNDTGKTKTTVQVETNVKILHQTYASCVASLTIFISAFWTLYISPVLIKFEHHEVHYNVTSSQAALIVSVMDFSNFLSAVPAGLMMTKYGRKPTLILSAFVFTVASVCAILSNGPFLLFWARTFAGIGKGLAFTVSPLYVAEISSKTIRGATGSAFYAAFCAGNIICCAMGPYVSFRTLNYVSIVFPIVFIVLIIPLPESPFFYIIKKNDAGAEMSLTWFRNTSTTRLKLQTINELDEIKKTVTENVAQKKGFLQIFQNRVYRRALTIVCFVVIAQRTCGISYFLSYGAIDLPLSNLWFGPQECLISYAVGSVISNSISALYVDSLGRKPILLISTVTSCLGLVISAIYFTVIPYSVDSHYFWIPYTVFIGSSITFTFGLGVIPAVLQGEILPAEIKRHASAIVVMIASLSSFTVNMTHDFIVRHCGVAGMYYEQAAFCLFFSVWFYFKIFETKGKSFIEIQRELLKASDKQPLLQSAQQVSPVSTMTNIREYFLNHNETNNNE